MSILDKLFGHEEQPRRQDPQPPQQPYPANPPQQPAQTSDQQAIARYQYMLKTAPPETIEQAHQEAFAQLTPEQRRLVLQQLTNAAPANERPPANAADDPQALARAATRAEVRQPGTLERLFGSSGPGGGGGGMGFGGSLLTGLAGAFVGTAIADHFFRGPMGSGFMGSGMGGFGGGGGYGGGTVVNETVNNYGSDDRDSEDDDRNDQDRNDNDNSSDDNSDDNANDSDSDSSFDDSADYGDAGGDDSGGGVDV